MQDLLREACGFPFVITSGYRSLYHSVEIKKEKPGTHTQGIACDIRAKSGVEKYKIVAAAISMGFSGIGIHKDFIHVDDRVSQKVIWNY